MNAGRARLLFATVGFGVALSSIFGTLLLRFRAELREEVRRTVIGRDAAVLLPVAHQHISGAELRASTSAIRADEVALAILPSAQQEGVLAVAVFDSQGALVRALPETLLFAELPATDYLALLRGEPVSRFYPDFDLPRYFRGAEAQATAPVLEVLLPLFARRSGQSLGFAQFYLDARELQRELAAIDDRVRRQTWLAFGAGVASLALVLAVASFGLARAQRLVAERNERLARANFELTLAAKTSALGQLTSHLIHGLQGSVASLRTAVASDTTDLALAAHQADRMQSMISEVVGLLGDARVGATYELSASDLAQAIRHRAAALAAAHALKLSVTCQFSGEIGSRQGSLLCLIAANLIDNAAAAAGSGARIDVEVREQPGDLTLTVADDGPGIPDQLRERLFEPGVSGRLGGTGLGLAISQLMARQLNGELQLVNTGPLGTVFRARIPRAG